MFVVACFAALLVVRCCFLSIGCCSFVCLFDCLLLLVVPSVLIVICGLLVVRCLLFVVV